MLLLSDYAQRPSALDRLEDWQLSARLFTTAFKAAYLFSDAGVEVQARSADIWELLSLCDQRLRHEVDASLADYCRSLLGSTSSSVA